MQNETRPVLGDIEHQLVARGVEGEGKNWVFLCRTCTSLHH